MGEYGEIRHGEQDQRKDVLTAANAVHQPRRPVFQRLGGGEGNEDHHDQKPHHLQQRDLHILAKKNGHQRRQGEGNQQRGCHHKHQNQGHICLEQVGKKWRDGAGGYPAQQQGRQAIARPDLAEQECDGNREKNHAEQQEPGDPKRVLPRGFPDTGNADREKAEKQQDHHEYDGIGLKRLADPRREHTGQQRSKAYGKQKKVFRTEHRHDPIPLYRKLL